MSWLNLALLIVVSGLLIWAAIADLRTRVVPYIPGWGMLVAGAGSLYLADWFGTSGDAYDYQAWQWTYCAMALAMLVGVATTLGIDEPPKAVGPDRAV